METVNEKEARSERYLVNFTASELELIKAAATKDQAAISGTLGMKYPNRSIFIAQAAVEKAKKLLRK